jgi:hypothetical protein
MEGGWLWTLLRKVIYTSKKFTVYRITGGSLYAATSSLKRVTGRIFTISKCFLRNKPKLNILLSPLNYSNFLIPYEKNTINQYFKVQSPILENVSIKDIVQPKKRGVERGTIQTVLTAKTTADIF